MGTKGVSNRGGEVVLENGVLVVDGGELVGVRWLLVLCRDGLTFTLFNVMDSSRVGRWGSNIAWVRKSETASAPPATAVGVPMGLRA